jgi:hypothetical protein
VVIRLKFLNQEYILQLFPDFNNLCVFLDLFQPHEWLEKNKFCLDTMSMSIKMDLMNGRTTLLMEEKEKIKGRVNSWGGEAKQNGRSTIQN